MGRLVIAFAAATFVASVAAWLATGWFLVDLGAPIVAALGIGVMRRNARALTWSIVVMACYAILPFCLAMMAAMGPERMLEGPRLFLDPKDIATLERPMRFLAQPGVIASFVVIGVLAAALTTLLTVLARRQRRAETQAGLPPLPER